jgi:poly(3-hydroxybutyrate) depolymerase
MATAGAPWLCVIALSATPLLVACNAQEAALPTLGVELSATSVSGLSAGAYMAGQFQVAHSRMVVGAGIVAGGPYGCAESAYADAMPGPGAAFINLSKAMNGCMLDAMQSWGVPDPVRLAERARSLAQKERIDAIEGVAQDRVYLFSGTNDRTVLPSIVRAAAQLYEQLGVPPANIKLVTDLPAGHAFLTRGSGIACGRTGEPYISNCNYDQAGELLQQIYGALQPRTTAPTGDFIVFDQREFTRDLPSHGLASSGVAYVPLDCRLTQGCRVHVIFHGCNQQRERLGDVFVKESGYAGWADANRLVLLYPQVTSTTVNPQACWDWWGYTGRDYLTRNGPQIEAVRRMLERLSGQSTVSRS